MIGLVNKIINDTLKIKGKYSMKRILVAVSFPYTLLIGWRISFYKDTPENAVQVFSSLLAFIVGVVITNAYAKKQEVKEEITNE